MSPYAATPSRGQLGHAVSPNLNSACQPPRQHPFASRWHLAQRSATAVPRFSNRRPSVSVTSPALLTSPASSSNRLDTGAAALCAQVLCGSRAFHHGRQTASRRRRNMQSWGCRASGSDPETAVLLSSSDTPSASGSDDSTAAGLESSSGADSGVATIQLIMPRRRLQVTFTCNVCDSSTQRMVNPVAWDKGLVMAQCSGCGAWHKLRDEGNLIQEIRYTDESEDGSESLDAGSSSSSDGS